MQNKANFKKLPIYANTYTRTTYEDFYCFWQPKNKANSKPIQSQFPKRQKMNASSVYTKDYENEHPWKAKKTNPIKPNYRKARDISRMTTEDGRVRKEGRSGQQGIRRKENRKAGNQGNEGKEAKRTSRWQRQFSC